MNCACDFDKGGNVTSGCLAHAEWSRGENKGACNNEAHKDYGQLVRDLEYQRKRADLFERMLIQQNRPSV